MADLSVTIQGMREKVFELSNSQPSHLPRLLPCLSPCARSSLSWRWGLQMWYWGHKCRKSPSPAAAEKGCSRFRIKPSPRPHVFIFKLAAVPTKLSCPLCVPSCSSRSLFRSSGSVCGVTERIGWGDWPTPEQTAFPCCNPGWGSLFSHQDYAGREVG